MVAKGAVIKRLGSRSQWQAILQLLSPNAGSQALMKKSEKTYCRKDTAYGFI